MAVNWSFIEIHFFRSRSFNDFRIVYKTLFWFAHEIHLVSYFVCACFYSDFSEDVVLYIQVKIERHLFP